MHKIRKSIAGLVVLLLVAIVLAGCTTGQAFAQQKRYPMSEGTTTITKLSFPSNMKSFQRYDMTVTFEGEEKVKGRVTFLVQVVGPIVNGQSQYNDQTYYWVSNIVNARTKVEKPIGFTTANAGQYEVTVTALHQGGNYKTATINVGE